jgi:hypothetical protein
MERKKEKEMKRNENKEKILKNDDSIITCL